MEKRFMTAGLCAAICAGAMTLTGCDSTGVPFIDEIVDEKSDELASYGKSVIDEKADDLASYGKSVIEEKADDLASYGKSYVEEKATEMMSDVIEESSENSTRTAGILISTEDINLHSADGGEKNYSFTYGEEEFSAVYWEDHWKIIDSYKIQDSGDMVIICQALIDVHPIHGLDMETYRTPEDMAYEWIQHNLAYEYLPEDNEWRQKSKDVDFNPEDQGKSFIEIYEQRTGKEFKFSEIMGD